MFTPHINPEAQEDMTTASHWYEQQRKGLGKIFLARVQEAIDNICRRPDQHAPIYKNVRRARVKRFLDGVFYRVDGSQVTIVAIQHGRRHSRSWKRRV